LNAAGRIDAHCHLWQLDRGDYDWLDRANPVFGPIARDFTTSDLTERLGAAGIGQAIVVQAAATEAETRFLLSLARTSPHIAGVVGWADLAAPDASERIATLAADPQLKGLRPMLQDIADTDWLLNVPRPGAWQAMAQYGLRFDALVKPRHLPMLLRFCRAHPDLPVVIDHAAKPDLALPRNNHDMQQWAQGMAALAADTRCCCKLSGLLTEMAPQQLPEAFALLAPVVDDLLGWFGPDRLMWGSDWPVVRMAGSYDIWNGLTDQLIGDLTAAEQAMIRGGTAAQFYGIGGEQS
jgi:L-fuconolactonase